MIAWELAAKLFHFRRPLSSSFYLFLNPSNERTNERLKDWTTFANLLLWNANQSISRLLPPPSSCCCHGRHRRQCFCCKIFFDGAIMKNIPRSALQYSAFLSEIMIMVVVRCHTESNCMLGVGCFCWCRHHKYDIRFKFCIRDRLSCLNYYFAFIPTTLANARTESYLGRIGVDSISHT